MKVEETLARWQAEEDAVRARLALTAGYARPEQIEGLTGQQMLDALFAGKLPRVPIGDTLGFVPIRIEHGLAIFQGRPQGKYYNPLGSIHGGWFAALLDSAVGCAVHSTLPVGKGYTTLELKLNIVRALTEAVPLVRAEGKLVHGGRQVATAEGRLEGPDGKLYAHATTTCLIFDRPSPGASPVQTPASKG
jgi:uncharacterized protein (TIGR00369 family)